MRSFLCKNGLALKMLPIGSKCMQYGLSLIVGLFYARKHCFPNGCSVGLKSKDCKPLRENYFGYCISAVCSEWKWATETIIIITNLSKSLYIILQTSMYCLSRFKVMHRTGAKSTSQVHGFWDLYIGGRFERLQRVLAAGLFQHVFMRQSFVDWWHRGWSLFDCLTHIHCGLHWTVVQSVCLACTQHVPELTFRGHIVGNLICNSVKRTCDSGLLSYWLKTVR